MQASICKSLFDPEIIRSGDDFLSLRGLIGDITSLGANGEKWGIIEKWAFFQTDVSKKKNDFWLIIFGRVSLKPT